MNILLIRPPSHFSDNKPKYDLPIGLLSIAAYLLKNNHVVTLIDGSTFDTQVLFWEHLEETVRTNTPFIVGITQQYTHQFKHAKAVALKIKALNQRIIVVAGGADISVRYEHILTDSNCFDILVRGEGEYTFEHIIKSIQGQGDLASIKGIAFKKGNTIVTQPPECIRNLDDLPLPAYHLVDMERYFKLSKDSPTRTRWIYPGSERGVTMITSRGCPYTCNFCSVHLHMGRLWRAHCSEYISNHMRFLIENYGVRYFHFEDDNFTLDQARFSRILDFIIDNKWNITWDTPNGIRIDSLNRDLLRKMKVSGMTFTNVGIESGVQRVLDTVIHKKLDLEKVKEIARIAQEEKIHLKGFYIIGFPGETKQDIQDTISFALKMTEKYHLPGGIAIAVPLFGTELYNQCNRGGYFTKEVNEDNIASGYLEEGLIKTDQFDPAFLANILKYYVRQVRWIKFKLIFKNIVRDHRLLVYLVKRLLNNPGLWRHYLSEIAYWNYLLFQNNINE